MSRKPKKPPLSLDISFEDALARFAKTDPNEVKDSMLERAEDIVEDTKKRADKRRKKIEDGVRKPGKKIPL